MAQHRVSKRRRHRDSDVVVLVLNYNATISNEGDILIHAGDFTEYGLVSEVVASNNWMASLPHKVNVIPIMKP